MGPCKMLGLGLGGGGLSRAKNGLGAFRKEVCGT